MGKAWTWTKGLFKRKKKAPVNNPVPDRMARIIPEDIADDVTSLGKPGSEDVFVTAADDIKDISKSEDLAKKLTLENADGSPVQGPFRVIEFDTPKSGVASPVNRTDPGFVGNGQTAGKAREFVIPNKKLEEVTNKTERTINN